jgi:hypothetical protein
MAPTLFTWGYYGWGNATPQLVEAVDAVETSRGFQPPIFVDIRIRRIVRAKGFQGSAFEKLLGPTRHRWMKSLGNRYVETRTGPIVQIADPGAAEDLLALAQEAATNRQRVLFFCSCQFPRSDGELACHRDTVATLVLKAAAKRQQPVQIIEWPGGEPEKTELSVTSEIFKAVGRGRASIPLGKSPDLSKLGGLPWGSIVTIHSGDQGLHLVSGPAAYQRSEWVLPVLGFFYETETPITEIEEQAAELRRSLGLVARKSGQKEPA